MSLCLVLSWGQRLPCCSRKSSDTCSVSLPWDVSCHGLGHSLGSDTLRGDQVRFNNINSFHISSETLQVTELLCGVYVVSWQMILRKFVFQSSVDRVLSRRQSWLLGAFNSRSLTRHALCSCCCVPGLCSSWDTKSKKTWSLHSSSWPSAGKVDRDECRQWVCALWRGKDGCRGPSHGSIAVRECFPGQHGYWGNEQQLNRVTWRALN